MRRFIFYLIRKRIGVAPFQLFRFRNQPHFYYFDTKRLELMEFSYVANESHCISSGVGLNELLQKEGKIIKCEKLKSRR